MSQRNNYSVIHNSLKEFQPKIIRGKSLLHSECSTIKTTENTILNFLRTMTHISEDSSEYSSDEYETC